MLECIGFGVWDGDISASGSRAMICSISSWVSAFGFDV